MSLNIPAFPKTYSVLEQFLKDVVFISLLCLMIYWVTSNLGSLLFKNQPNNYIQLNRTFDVLVYRHPYYSEQYIKDPLGMCPVKNCIFTTNETTVTSADVIVVLLSRSRTLPWLHKRNPNQKWVLLTVESPASDASYAPIDLEDLADIFNWTMTYRSDSDVPSPYGRVEPLPRKMVKKINKTPISSLVPHWKDKQRDALAVAMISNCAVLPRLNYIRELQKYIKVDLYGRCARTIGMKEGCPGQATMDCWRLKHYHFYLAFENSNCRQYLTEKVFHNAFTKGAIPVVMGAPVSDYEKLLPPYSFIHVNSFNSPRDLAFELIHLSKKDEYILEYHQWRRFFKITNEHGSFGRTPYELCRLCQALNYNDNVTKIYDIDMLRLYFDPKLLCETVTSPYHSVVRSGDAGVGAGPIYVTSPKWKGPRRVCKKRIINL